MKRFSFVITVLIAVTMLIASDKAGAEDFFDVDYNFIDRAFDGIKPVSDEQFNKTVNQLTPKPVDNSFKGKLKTFFLGRQYGVEPPKGQDREFNNGGDKKAIDDIKNGIYYLKLVVSIQGSDGNIIPLGNYKIKEEKQNDENILVFLQGDKRYGYLKLKNFQDGEKQDALTYSRVDIINDDIVRVVYSTLGSTQCAYAKVFK